MSEKREEKRGREGERERERAQGGLRPTQPFAKGARAQALDAASKIDIATGRPIL